MYVWKRETAFYVKVKKQCSARRKWVTDGAIGRLYLHFSPLSENSCDVAAAIQLGAEERGEGARPRCRPVSSRDDVVEEIQDQVSLESNKLQLVDLAGQVPVPVWEWAKTQS